MIAMKFVDDDDDDDHNYHCLSLFTVQRLSDCHCMLRTKQQAVHTAGGQRWEFYFSPIKYAIPIPISSPKLLPFQWESHGNGNCIPLSRGLLTVTGVSQRLDHAPARTPCRAHCFCRYGNYR